MSIRHKILILSALSTEAKATDAQIERFRRVGMHDAAATATLRSMEIAELIRQVQAVRA